MSRYVYIAVLVLAGETVFGLPFATARFFRPTMLEVFGFSNTQLGDLFAVYGITAMLCYFPGGAVADRYSARTLLATSLIATGLGGLYMATIPGAMGMAVLYGFWGVTTIFLFWGALIRATREWGGGTEQGMAFGLLEGGRGAVAAIVASMLVGVLAFYMPDDAALATDAERLAGFRMVILGYSAITIAVGVLAWMLVPTPEEPGPRRAKILPNMRLVLGSPIIWAQAAIVVCAYCIYKAADYYSLYLVVVMGMDEVEGARVASWGAYIRPSRRPFRRNAIDRGYFRCVDAGLHRAVSGCSRKHSSIAHLSEPGTERYRCICVTRHLFRTAAGDANAAPHYRRCRRHGVCGGFYAGNFLCANRRPHPGCNARRRRFSWLVCTTYGDRRHWRRGRCNIELAQAQQEGR
jgi:MFS family permease